MKKLTPTPSMVLIKDYNNPNHKDPSIEHSLKLCICYSRKRVYYPTKLKYRVDDWGQINRIKPPKKFQADKNKSDRVLNNAKAVLEMMNEEGMEFTFARFETLWYQKKPTGTEFNQQFRVKYEELRQIGQRPPLNIGYP